MCVRLKLGIPVSQLSLSRLGLCYSGRRPPGCRTEQLSGRDKASTVQTAASIARAGGRESASCGLGDGYVASPAIPRIRAHYFFCDSDSRVVLKEWGEMTRIHHPLWLSLFGNPRFIPRLIPYLPHQQVGEGLKNHERFCIIPWDDTLGK